MKKYIRT